jgi:hypothetical protein
MYQQQMRGKALISMHGLGQNSGYIRGMAEGDHVLAADMVLVSYQFCGDHQGVSVLHLEDIYCLRKSMAHMRSKIFSCNLHGVLLSGITGFNSQASLSALGRTDWERSLG